MADERLVYLRELAAHEESLAAEVRELDELARITAGVRERACHVVTVLETEGDERARLTGKEVEAAASLVERAAGLEAAERESAEAERDGDDGRRAEAARRLVRARDAHAAAGQLLAEQRDRLAGFEQTVADARRDGPVIERRVSKLASTLQGRPRIPTAVAAVAVEGLHEVGPWGVAVRAALAVARSGAAAERDGALRQANELGTVLLGEDVVATSAAAVISRVEAEGGRHL